MKRKTLLKYTNRMLLLRLVRLCKMAEHLATEEDIEDNEIEINNTEGIILDRMMGIKYK